MGDDSTEATEGCLGGGSTTFTSITVSSGTMRHNSEMNGGTRNSSGHGGEEVSRPWINSMALNLMKSACFCYHSYVTVSAGVAAFPVTLEQHLGCLKK